MDNAIFPVIVNGGLGLSGNNHQKVKLVCVIENEAEKPDKSFDIIKDTEAVKKQWHGIKKAGLWGYGIVVSMLLLAMIYLVINNEPLDKGPITQVSENEVQISDNQIQISNEKIQTILEASDGAIAIELENLDALVPVATTEPAWRKFAASWSETDTAHIAIIIDDLGLNLDMSRQLMAIDGPLTLSFLPYAEDLPSQVKRLRSRGHEIMVHLPMEPKDKRQDPGPNALMSGLPSEEFERRIAWNLSRFDGFVGINNHMGSALTENPGLMVRVMVGLRKQGYLFVDSLTSPKSIAMRAATATGVPHIARDIFLDNKRSVPAILAQLEKTTQIAHKRGYAIAIGHPYSETLKAIQFWSAGLDKRKYTLVPVSQLITQAKDHKKALAGLRASAP